MNGQYYRDHLTPAPFTPKNVNETDLPDENSEPVPGQVPAEPGMVNETPMGGTLANAGLQNEPHASVIPHYEVPVKEDQIGDPIPVVGRLEDTAPYKPTPNAAISEDWGSKPKLTMPTVAAPVVKPDSTVGSSALSTALLNTNESEHFRTKWNEIQGKFVDEPRIAVQQADALVAEVVEKITQMFSTEHTSLESQWNQGSEVSTEDLRKALQRYRSFFNRLVV